MPAPELAVVIVTWNVREMALGAIRSLYDDLNRSGLDAEVWVVDNASEDGTADAIRDEFPAVHLIASDSNLGFAAGNNLALRQMGFEGGRETPRTVFLLNPDTIVLPGAVKAMYDVLWGARKIGWVGARLSYGDGSFQHSAFAFPGLAQLVIDLFPVPARIYESRINGRYPRRLYERREPFPVDHTLGATMMLKGAVISEVGLLDEGFYMYCEEIDWAMRVRRAGWEIYCVPSAHVTHLAGKSTSQMRAESIVHLWKSRMRLYRKHYSPAKAALARLLIRLGMRWKLHELERRRSRGGMSDAEYNALREAYEMVGRL